MITTLYSDDPNLCEVTYTDGDKEDMDVREVEEALELYKQEFSTED